MPLVGARAKRQKLRVCSLPHFPQTRITVNLAPADLRKEGPAYDLPIAIGVLSASDQMRCARRA